MTEIKQIKTTEHEEGQAQRFATFKATQIIWLLLGLLEGILALRVIFKLIGVNPANAFATFLYGITGIFVAPFSSLTGTPVAGGMVLEVSTIIAMVVYLLVGWALERIVYVVFYRSRGPVSFSQTSVVDHTPPQAAASFSQTTIERTTTQSPDEIKP
jgi:hypothetical protein